MGQFERNLENGTQVRELLESVGMDVEEFRNINAVSDKQYQFAISLKMQAVVTLRDGLVKNDRMTRAILLSVNEQEEATFWCDNQNVWDNYFNTKTLFVEAIRRYMAE